jgi:hypothetical protein
MLLNVPAEVLPDQAEIKDRQAYAHALRVFLRKHFSVTYAEVDPSVSAGFGNAAHVMIGETVRTTPTFDTWHAVVGVGGKLYWDVHPSRAGLTTVERIGILVPIPVEWETKWSKLEADKDPTMACRCPACSHTKDN